MAHRTGITLRLTPADRAALEALQAFTGERTATRAIDIAVKRYPDTCRAVQKAEADRDQARGGRCSNSWTRWTRWITRNPH